MNVADPLGDVVTGARGRLLSVIVRLERPTSIIDLATTADVDPRHAGRIIDELLVAGIVTETRSGRARMILANRDHLAYGPLSALVATRQRLVEALRALLEPEESIAGAWLFGSAARGDGDTDSDIDILLVTSIGLDGPGWEEITASLRDQVSLWTGNDVQLVEHSPPSLAQLVTSASPLIAGLRRDGITLVDRGAELLRGAA